MVVLLLSISDEEDVADDMFFLTKKIQVKVYGLMIYERVYLKLSIA